MLTGVLFVSVLGTLLHFAYAASNQNTIIGLFTPINESTWEHMKLLFFPMCLFSLVWKFNEKDAYPCLASALQMGVLLGTLLIAVFFYTYTGAWGVSSAIVNILIFYISVVAAFYIAYKTTLSCGAQKHAHLWGMLCLILAVLFILFTLFPPQIPLFTAP